MHGFAIYDPRAHLWKIRAWLKNQANTLSLTSFVIYVYNTCFVSSVWSPSQWDIFKQSIHTNNDIEGCHSRLHGNAKRGQLQFYLLVELPHRASQLVTLQAEYVGKHKLQRYQRSTYKKLQAILLYKFNKVKKTTKQLLRACSRINAPSTNI